MTAPTTTEVEHPVSQGYGCAIGERLFRLAVAPGRELTVVTAPLEAPRVNTTSSPEEATAEFGLIFARSEFDGGSGLFRAHAEDAAPNRYWDSANVSVRPAEPGEFPTIRLLHNVTNVDSTTNDDLRLAYDDEAHSLYMTDGVVLRRTDNPSADTPTWVDDDPAAAETLTQVYDVAVLGDEIYAALGAQGLHVKEGTWGHWSDVLATRVWATKGRIVASDGPSLYEVTAAGAAPSALITLAPGKVWTDVCDGGSHVLAAATDGYVYAFSTDTGSLVLAGQTLFEAEVPQALGQSQGVVGIGTAQGNVGRLYVGVVNENNGQIVDQQLIKTWGATGTTTDQTPYRIHGTRASLYTGTVDEDGASHLWHYDLASGGISESVCARPSTGVIRGIETVRGRLIFTADGLGAYAEADTYTNDGWLMSPLADFYSAAEKSWIGARLETGEINGGAIVELYYSTNPDALSDPEHSSWKRITRRTSEMGGGEMSMSNVVSRHLAGMVKLYPGLSNTVTPEVRSFSFRAYPSSGDQDKIVTLPLNVSDQVERPGRRATRVPGRGATEYSALLALEGRPETLTLYRPRMVIKGLVEEVGTPVQAITRRGSVTMISQVTIRGRLVGSSGVTSGAGPLGTYRLLGVPPAIGVME